LLLLLLLLLLQSVVEAPLHLGQRLALLANLLLAMSQVGFPGLELGLPDMFYL